MGNVPCHTQPDPCQDSALRVLSPARRWCLLSSHWDGSNTFPETADRPPMGHCPGGMRRYTELHSLHRDPESKCTIQYCSRQPLMGGEDKTSVKCWQHHIPHHLLGLDTHFFFLNCECFYVQPRIQRSFTATSQLAGPIFPSIHRTAVRYSCKVTTVKILRYSQKSWDAALCCSDFIVKSHMPSLCLQSATVFLLNTRARECQP